MHQFLEVLNIVQATINQNRTVFGYVTKQKISIDTNVNSESIDKNISTETEMYEAFIVELKGKEIKIHSLDTKKSKQVRIQFLYKEKEHGQWDKFLLLIHQECKNHIIYIKYISMYISYELLLLLSIDYSML